MHWYADHSLQLPTMALHINADVVNIEHQVVQPPAPPLPAVQAPGELPHAAPQPAHADGAQERDQLRERVAELEEELAAAHQQVNEQAANIAELQHRANARRGRIVALQREVAERNRRIGNLQRRVNAQDHEIMDLRRRVNARDHEIMDLRQELEWENVRVHNAACRPHEILWALGAEIPPHLPHT
ncbi:hypothetical protein EV363DRAFT_857542 [Boletus edulis]|nr:hypothetical protein EV363DRAFT_857542 [Boletus edulis]